MSEAETIENERACAAAGGAACADADGGDDADDEQCDQELEPARENDEADVTRDEEDADAEELVVVFKAVLDDHDREREASDRRDRDGEADRGCDVYTNEATGEIEQECRPSPPRRPRRMRRAARDAAYAYDSN